MKDFLKDLWERVVNFVSPDSGPYEVYSAEFFIHTTEGTYEKIRGFRYYYEARFSTPPECLAESWAQDFVNRGFTKENTWYSPNIVKYVTVNLTKEE